MLHEEDQDSGLDPGEFSPNDEIVKYTDETDNIIEIDHDLMQISISPYNTVKLQHSNNYSKNQTSNGSTPSASPLVSNSSDSDDPNIKIELLTKKSEIRKNVKSERGIHPHSKKFVGNLFLSSGNDEHLRKLFTRKESNVRDDFSSQDNKTTNSISTEPSSHKAKKNNAHVSKNSTYNHEKNDSETNFLNDSNGFDLNNNITRKKSLSPLHSPAKLLPANNMKLNRKESIKLETPEIPMKESHADESDNYYKNYESDKDVDKKLLASSIEIILSRDGSDKPENVFQEIDALKTTEGVSEDHIVSAVGTVRGVKNRVKERLLNYLSNIEKKKNEEKEKPKKMYLTTDRENSINAKSNYVLSTAGKVIIYITSLGLIRKTKSDCVYVRNAFRNLMYKTEERDITDPIYRNEYCKLFGGLLPPQVIIDGKHIGGKDKLELLIETGQIKAICKNIEKIAYEKESCETCAGHGYINCPRCLGSGRAKTLRYSGTRELSYLKCTYCKNGLLRCYDCIDAIH